MKKVSYIISLKTSCGIGDSGMTLARFFSKNPRYETERLLLRKLSPEDTEDMYEYASLYETSKYLLWEPHPSPAYTADLIRFLQNEYRTERYSDFAIILKGSGKMIGTVGFTSYDEKNSVMEVGYVISPDYWHRGIATEALKAILSISFNEFNVQRAEAKYMPENVYSRSVMEKCGMTYEGTARGRMLVKGVRRDIAYYSILKDEYFKIYGEKPYVNTAKPRGILRFFDHGDKN